MALVDKLPPETREVPHEPGNSMSFRMLAGVELEDAQAAALRELNDRYPLEIMKSLRELNEGGVTAGEKEQAAKEAADADPLSGYSVRALLRCGVTAWSGPKYEGTSLSEEALEKLDQETRRWAALQVLDVSRITTGPKGEAPSSVAGSGTNGTERPRPVSAPSGSPS